MPKSQPKPGLVRVAVIAEHEVISEGLRSVLSRFKDEVHLVEPGRDADVALWSTFGAVRLPDYEQIRRDHHARRVVVLCWDLEPEMVRASLQAGADGYLSTTLSGRELIEAIGRIHRGEVVVSPEPRSEGPGETLPQWPGQQQGLSEREGDIVALIARGLSNDDIAGQLFLSINTVKSYIRTAYRKMGVTTRTRAVLWAMGNGLEYRSHQANEEAG